MRTLCCAVLIACLIVELRAGPQEPSPVTIHGALHDSAGNPIGNITIWFDHGSPVTGESDDLEAWADAQGHFEISLPRGQYTVKTRPALCGVKAASFTADGSSLSSNFVVLRLDKISSPDSKPSDTGVASNIGNVMLPDKFELGLSATKGLYGSGTWNLPANPFPTNMKGLVGGHLVKTEVCDPRLEVRKSEPRKEAR